MKKNIFKGVKVDTQSFFNRDGSINIFPQVVGRRRIVVSDKTRVTQKGRIVTKEDGTSEFQPYARNSGSRYSRLWEEVFGVLKMSKTRLVMHISVPLDEDDPISWMESVADMLMPSHTDSQVVEAIEDAIRKLK